MTTKKNFANARLTSAVRLLAPNPFLAMIVIVLMGVELVLVSFNQENIYQSSRTAIVGVALVAWFWVTLGWSLFLAGRVCRALTRERSRTTTFLIWSAVTLAIVSLIFCYGVSWFLFFHSGRFANLETWRFVAFNFDHLWSYVVAAEPVHLLTASLLIFLSFAFVPITLYFSSQTDGSQGRANLTTKRVAVWMCLWLCLCGAWWNLRLEPSFHRRVSQTRVIKHQLHPSMTLYASQLETRRRNKLKDTIDTSQLIPLSTSEPWNPRPVRNDDPSIIIIAVESLRADTIHQYHQGREILPNINALSRNGLELTRAYSQSTHSDYADVCLVSSLYPLRTINHFYYGPHDPFPRTLIYDLLEPTGYATAIISSQNEAWGGMDHFLKRPSLQHFYHPETSHADTVYSEMDFFGREVSKGGFVAGKLPDQHTTTEAIEWIQSQTEKKQPFFLSMNFQSSHFPYLIPDECPRPFQPATLDPNTSFVDYPKEQTENVRNAYFNAIHECDRQVGRLVSALRELGQLDNTILIITGENGEAFHECGTVTHAREPVQPAIHVACVIHAPKHLDPGIESYPFEHVDLVPTIFGLLGRPPHPNFQGIDILSPDRQPADQRLTFCHVNSCFAESDSMMLGGRWKLTIDHRTQVTTLHDIENDPWQQEDLAEQRSELTEQLTTKLIEWRQNQLAYYHWPRHYLSFYPPTPPRWSSPFIPWPTPTTDTTLEIDENVGATH